MKLNKLTVLTVSGLGCAATLGAMYLVTAGSGTAPAGTNAGPAAPLVAPERIENVGVAGSDVLYPTAIEGTVGAKKMKLVLTGTALRKKVLFNVYTIGCYVQEGIAVSSPDDLCSKDCGKQLHLVMERAVTGAQMAEAFHDAIRQNYPKPAFDKEIAALSQKLRALELVKGDQVWLTTVPEVGLTISVVGKATIAIDSPAFAKAMWEVYLGKKNIGEPIKAGLVSRLK
ncbi:MAG: chalcone isomerase [Planctomycetaceae bacterium]|nr:chalcone isomerase [Planctomycetaceae bacterium]